MCVMYDTNVYGVWPLPTFVQLFQSRISSIVHNAITCLTQKLRTGTDTTMFLMLRLLLKVLYRYILAASLLVWQVSYTVRSLRLSLIKCFTQNYLNLFIILALASQRTAAVYLSQTPYVLIDFCKNTHFLIYGYVFGFWDKIFSIPFNSASPPVEILLVPTYNHKKSL